MAFFAAALAVGLLTFGAAAVLCVAVELLLVWGLLAATVRLFILPATQVQSISFHFLIAEPDTVVEGLVHNVHKGKEQAA